MQHISNPWREAERGPRIDPATPFPSTDTGTALALVRRCPEHAETPLLQMELPSGATLRIKDERGRFGLGSFKALGAAYVIAQDAVASPGGRLDGRTYVTASAGNHGLSVATGARIFGARSVVYIAQTVPESFADRLRDAGAEVVREGDIYEASMQAAANAAERNGWALLSDSSWPGYFDRPHRLMEGYTILMAEVAARMDAPTHVFLQAGVGGLAGACAAVARTVWGDAPRIVVVEPVAAPALHGAIRAGRFAVSEGPVSAMGRLDCKEPSLIALKGLARDADFFALIEEREAQDTADWAIRQGLASTPSGVAGLAAALRWDLPADATVLCILSEGPEA